MFPNHSYTNIPGSPVLVPTSYIKQKDYLYQTTLTDLVKLGFGNLNIFRFLEPQFYKTYFEAILKNTNTLNLLGAGIFLWFYTYGYDYFTEKTYSVVTPFTQDLNKLEQDDARPLGKYFQKIYELCTYLYMEDLALAKYIRATFEHPKSWFITCLLEQYLYDLNESKTTHNFSQVNMWESRICSLTKGKHKPTAPDSQDRYNPYEDKLPRPSGQALITLIHRAYAFSESPSGTIFRKTHWVPFIDSQKDIVKRLKMTQSKGKHTNLKSIRFLIPEGKVQEKSINSKGVEGKYKKAIPLNEYLEKWR